MRVTLNQFRRYGVYLAIFYRFSKSRRFWLFSQLFLESRFFVRSQNGKPWFMVLSDVADVKAMVYVSGHGWWTRNHQNGFWEIIIYRSSSERKLPWRLSHVSCCLVWSQLFLFLNSIPSLSDVFFFCLRYRS